MDAYRWVSKWKTQFAPLARCSSFPVSSWAYFTVNH